jgi:DNA-cytosine methyltransferase
MSCGQIAINKNNIKYDNYIASEIDSHAIKITKKNFPKTIHIGDVTKIDISKLPRIDLLMGGSPCQGFSCAGLQYAFTDERSKLFFQFIKIMNDVKPKYFLLENVVMKKQHQDVITKLMGVEPILINSSDFSISKRKRLYWTNIPLDDYVIKNIYLKDFLDGNEALYLKDVTDRFYSKKEGTLAFKKSRAALITPNHKIRCLTAGGQGITNSGATNIKIGDRIYIPTPELCELAQNVPIGYTADVSETQRYKMLGNGWTVDVIAHILQGIL